MKDDRDEILLLQTKMKVWKQKEIAVAAKAYA